MKITSQLLEAYVQCPTKCWLRSAAEPATDSTPVLSAQAWVDSYVAAGIRRLFSTTPESEYLISPPEDSLNKDTWRLSTGVLARTSEFESYLHAVQCLPSKERRGKSRRFIPIRFVPANKLGKNARLLLAFDALVLSKMIKHEVQLGKIVHGDIHKILSVKTPTMELELRQHITKIYDLLSRPSPPSLILIPHCAECEFQTRCRQKALENDELTLLSGMTEKERNKLHDKGIFTVTQLSDTFRPRRRSKPASDKREKYRYSLRALAIRQKKIHIAGTPELALTGTPVYLDVEGLPDRDFYYLIGVRLGDPDSAVQHSFWADSVEDEKRIWDEFIGLIASVKAPVLIHTAASKLFSLDVWSLVTASLRGT